MGNYDLERRAYFVSVVLYPYRVTVSHPQGPQNIQPYFEMFKNPVADEVTVMIRKCMQFISPIILAVHPRLLTYTEPCQS